MTGDGLRFALRGAELAAAVALDVLAGAPASARTSSSPRGAAAALREVAVQSRAATAGGVAGRRSAAAVAARLCRRCLRR